MKRALAKRASEQAIENKLSPERTAEMNGLGRLLSASYLEGVRYYESLKQKLPDAYSDLTPEEIHKRATAPSQYLEPVQEIPVDFLE